MKIRHHVLVVNVPWPLNYYVLRNLHSPSFQMAFNVEIRGDVEEK